MNTSSLTVSVGPSGPLIVPSGFNPATGFGQLTNNGIVHVAGTVLNVSAGQSIIGTGTIYDLTSCEGVITAAGGPINMNGGVAISGNGSVSLGSGALSTDLTSSSMSGGSLFAGNEYIGYSGGGSFTQSGGTHNVSGGLYIGAVLGQRNVQS